MQEYLGAEEDCKNANSFLKNKKERSCKLSCLSIFEHFGSCFFLDVVIESCDLAASRRFSWNAAHKNTWRQMTSNWTCFLPQEEAVSWAKLRCHSAAMETFLGRGISFVPWRTSCGVAAKKSAPPSQAGSQQAGTQSPSQSVIQPGRQPVTKQVSQSTS